MRYLLILLVLSSCLTNSHWRKQGFKHGWLKESKDTLTASIAPDTIVGDSVINDFSDTIVKFIEKECPQIKQEERQVKQEIRYQTKEKLIPQYIKVAYPDTTIIQGNASVRLSFDTTGTIHADIRYKSDTIIKQTDNFWKGFWIGGGLVMLFFTTILIKDLVKPKN